MDVVKRNIEGMRGRVSVASRPGQGTTFRMVLPLTLAIIDGMLVACGNERYIIPSLAIVESLPPAPRTWWRRWPAGARSSTCAARSSRCSGSTALLQMEGEDRPATEAHVVVLEGLGRKVGLLVDDVLTQQQVVIKPLGHGMGDTDFLAGGGHPLGRARRADPERGPAHLAGRPGRLRREAAVGACTWTPRPSPPSRPSPTRRPGSSCGEGKAALIQARLAKRLRELGLGRRARLPGAAPRRRTGEEEVVLFLDAISTNFTKFYREPDHFETLGELARGRQGGRAEALPPLVRRQLLRRGALHHRHGAGAAPWQGCDWKVLATDISTRVLARAVAGEYGTEEVDVDPAGGHGPLDGPPPGRRRRAALGGQAAPQGAGGLPPPQPGDAPLPDAGARSTPSSAATS